MLLPHALPLRVRARQIALILTRHGLGYLVGMLGLEQFIPFHRGWFKHPRRDHPYTRPEHVRMALEDMGPTFIKLGQMISTRTDLIPPAYQVELVKLQDAAPAFPLDQIEQVLRDELGTGPDELFATFDRTPLATASIGQVHAATLSDGTEVVVKIRLFWTKRIEQAGLDAAWLGVELPQQLRRLLQTLERGEMQMNVQPVRVEPLMHRLEQISNRIVLGILAAAFINGLAILMSVYHPAGWRQWAGPLFAFGFFLALALGVVIAWGILRSRRL